MKIGDLSEYLKPYVTYKTKRNPELFIPALVGRLLNYSTEVNYLYIIPGKKISWFIK